MAFSYGEIWNQKNYSSILEDIDHYMRNSIHPESDSKNEMRIFYSHNLRKVMLSLDTQLEVTRSVDMEKHELVYQDMPIFATSGLSGFECQEV